MRVQPSSCDLAAKPTAFFSRPEPPISMSEQRGRGKSDGSDDRLAAGGEPYSASQGRLGSGDLGSDRKLVTACGCGCDSAGGGGVGLNICAREGFCPMVPYGAPERKRVGVIQPGLSSRQPRKDKPCSQQWKHRHPVGAKGCPCARSAWGTLGQASLLSR